MKILINNFGKPLPGSVYPKKCICFKCRSIIEVDKEDLHEESATVTGGKRYFRKIFMCPACGIKSEFKPMHL